MRLKELPVMERPRERLLEYGASSLANDELLSILLDTGKKGKNVKDLSLEVLQSCGNITNLQNITKEQLLSIDGIGLVKALKLLSAIELGKRIFLKVDKQGKVQMKNSFDIYQYVKYWFVGKEQECFYCLYLNNRNEVIERKLLFMGTINRSLVHPREVFKNAYLCSASSIICVHNHPSGDVRPSREDIRLTEALVKIGDLNAIPVIDHVIVGEEDYYSFCDEKMLSR
ncbi:MAG TPA: DNA repair protein RadC [Candidatus Scybalousia intestinigallinarum]|nr:DNA repair protein RadC [Candidatus Scybalousia intestinigallinarum]